MGNWKMNELIINADGTVTVVGDAGSVLGIIAETVVANTIPAVRDNGGNITTPAIVPDADILCVEVTRAELVVHPWRLPWARADRLHRLLAIRDQKISALDTLSIRAWQDGDDPAPIRAQRLVLEGLDGPIATALGGMTDTDVMDAYLPVELQ